MPAEDDGGSHRQLNVLFKAAEESELGPADDDDEEGSADKILTNEKSEDEMQNPCIVRLEDDLRDAPEAPTMDVEEVPEDPIDNVMGLENFDSDISEDSPKRKETLAA